MSILRTSDQMKAIVARLLAYVSEQGDSIGTLCPDRVYVRQAPDDANFTEPYLYLLRLNGETDPATGNLEQEFDVEATCVGGEPEQLELVADLFEQAMLTYRLSSSTDGLMYCTEIHPRDTVPVEKEPPNRNVLQIKVSAHVVAWPRMLSDVLT